MNSLCPWLCRSTSLSSYTRTLSICVTAPTSRCPSPSLQDPPQQKTAMAICQYVHRSPSSGARAGMLSLREKGQDQRGRSRTRCYQAGAMTSYPMTKPMQVLTSLAESLEEDQRGGESTTASPMHEGSAEWLQRGEARYTVQRMWRVLWRIRPCVKPISELFDPFQSGPPRVISHGERVYTTKLTRARQYPASLASSFDKFQRKTLASSLRLCRMRHGIFREQEQARNRSEL